MITKGFNFLGKPYYSRLFFLVIGIITSTLITSCEYEPDGTNVRKARIPTDYPSFSVIFNFENDTIYLTPHIESLLSYTSDDTLLIRAGLYFDETLMKEINSNKGEYALNFNTFFNQPHKLRIDLFRRSGSQSIADQMGKEGIVGTKQWIVIYKNEK